MALVTCAQEELIALPRCGGGFQPEDHLTGEAKEALLKSEAEQADQAEQAEAHGIEERVHVGADDGADARIAETNTCGSASKAALAGSSLRELEARDVRRNHMFLMLYLLIIWVRSYASTRHL